MTDPPVEFAIKTGCRLHLGLLPWPRSTGHRYAGVGLMLKAPLTHLRMSLAARDEILGGSPEVCQKLRQFVKVMRSWQTGPAASSELAQKKPYSGGYRIEVVSASPLHCGLGTGTQLGLCVAAGLRALRGELSLQQSPAMLATQLASIVGRGQRSAVGSHGFVQGGLLIDAGHQTSGTLGDLHDRVELPEHWRIVLMTPATSAGLSGSQERQAFGQLPQIPAAHIDELWESIVNEILPAAKLGDFAAFSEAVYTYGYQAGKLFSAVQHGAYATETTQKLVQVCRKHHVSGVGQTSWGPTVFALCESPGHAEEIAEFARSLAELKQGQVQISAPAHQGFELVSAADGLSSETTIC